MGKQRHSVTLRLRHPSLDPAEITANLDLPPHWAWRAGYPKRTPAGELIRTSGGQPVRIPRESYWSCGLAESSASGERLASAIEKLTAELEPHEAFFHRIRSEGGSVEFFIGWFIEGMAGEEFGYELLARLGRLQIDLS